MNGATTEAVLAREESAVVRERATSPESAANSLEVPESVVVMERVTDQESEVDSVEVTESVVVTERVTDPELSEVPQSAVVTDPE
ncbi:hypothetical protein DPMN_160426 [Dreissena polymorpha]|uniref:Uncharacterized protein n=1 Tax=Dreissena polymorpha TaxID=45954 RepID=A0A9D4IRM4_DREPO|nr:hypothetical protein DPMN_160426 [Dreissena polymorpha]